MEKWIESEGPKPDYRLLCIRLSDELDQLRARNEELEAELTECKKDIGWSHQMATEGKVEALEAEVARLRKLVREFQCAPRTKEDAAVKDAAQRLVVHARNSKQELWASLPDVLALAKVLEEQK